MADVRQEVVDGQQAKQLIENPQFKAALGKVRDGIIKAMANSALGDSETHNRLVISLQLLNQIEKQIKDVIDTGYMAEIQVNESLGKKISRIVR